ncbi:MAG: hypothetical protein WBP14_04160 [Candidatus Saccharimonas aalborgensis]
MSWFLNALGIIGIIIVSIFLMLVVTFIASIFREASKPWTPLTPKQVEAEHLMGQLRAVYGDIQYARAQQFGKWDTLRAADIARLQAEATTLRNQLARLGYDE